MKRALLIVCIVLLAIACAPVPTKPNISVLYRAPLETEIFFQRLCVLDSTLALEVGKLPEFQGKVGQRQILALARFTDLVVNATSEEKANLANLLQVGKPAFRRYCTPLQAIFWLLEIDNYKERSISLPSAYWMTHAWDLTDEDFTEGEEKSLLQYSLRWILEHAWDFNEQDRWGDFEIVTERLNSPELINYYERCNFKHVSHGECPGSARFIFKYKNACCSDYTRFSDDCLRKAGYKAIPIKVVSPTGKLYHVVCEYEDNGKEYIMDNSCYSCGNGKGITEKREYVKKLAHIGFGYM